MKGAEAFILSSLWEDPGFVIIEAAFCRTPVFSSNCITGPKEIIKNNYNGFLFESNNIESFLDCFEILLKKKNNSEVLLNNLRYTKKFTLFNHYIAFKDLITIT
jgi:glycosyltransferase involved in cell wall biosynthesis